MQVAKVRLFYCGPHYFSLKTDSKRTYTLGQLNPMQFSNLLRAAGVSMHNMHTEMSWYRMFDTDGQVGISLEDIKHGIHAMNKDTSIKATTKQLFVTYIKTLGASSVMSL